MDEDFRKISNRLEPLSNLSQELKELRITNPDSPRIKALENQMAAGLEESEREFEHLKKRVVRSKEGVDKFERLTFDLHKQMTTLCATLIIALLALAGIFDNVNGLRNAVGGASSNLLYAVIASVVAMLCSSATGLDWGLFEQPSDAPRYKRVFGKYVRWIGTVVIWGAVIASGLSVVFFLNGVFTLARFLSAG